VVLATGSHARAAIISAKRGNLGEHAHMTGLLDARYVHTNIVAADWRRLAGFYTSVFGCELVPPQRAYDGADLERGTGVSGAALGGVHLRLPGYGDTGPTLEIYQYRQAQTRTSTAANRPGFAHIAFAVEDVAGARQVVLVAGGRPVGEIVTMRTWDGRRVTWCYVTDPEGNILELQAWDQP
jgi:predicted enzyme related to lactoylglutathione lyase